MEKYLFKLWGSVYFIIVISIFMGIGILLNPTIGSAQKEFVWAQIDDYSGPFSATGEEGLRATVMFLEERDHKIGSFKIKLVTRDTELKPAVGVRRLNEVIDEFKPAVVSSGCSSAVQIAMQDIIGKRKGPVFWTEAGESRLTSELGNRYSFRWASPTYAIVKSTLYGFLEKYPEVKSMIQMQMDYAYGYDQAKFVENILKEKNVKLIKSQFIPMTATDISSFVTEAKISGADVCYMAFYGKIQGVGLNQAHEFGLNKVMKTLNCYATIPTLRGVKPEAVEGVFLADEWFPGMPNEWSRIFVEKYKKRWGVIPSNYAAQKYITCQLMEKVIVKTDSADPKVLIPALENLGEFDGPTGKEYISGWQHQVHHDYLLLRGKSVREKKFDDDFFELIGRARHFPKQGDEGFKFDRTKDPL
jgi:branched-chain amino acid transport system substrate-binding protein